MKISSYYSALIIAGTIITGCSKKNDPSLNNVIFNLSFDNSSPVADGTTIVNVTCQLDTDATSDRRNIKFTTTAGTFISTKDSTSVSQGAVFVGRQLIASVKLQVPQTEQTVTITAQPDLPNISNNNYMQTKTLSVSNSASATIALISGSSSIVSNYGSEASLTGVLKNKSGGKVSLGNKVIFQDFLENGTPANGNFRSTVDTTGGSSQVSTFYSIGTASVGSKILIKCSLKSDTSINSTTQLFISK